MKSLVYVVMVKEFFDFLGESDGCTQHFQMVWLPGENGR